MWNKSERTVNRMIKQGKLRVNEDIGRITLDEVERVEKRSQLKAI
jgi:hypothetical protein